MTDRLLAQYADGVNLLRCDWCMRPVLTEHDADLLRQNLAAIIRCAKQRDDPLVVQLAVDCLAVLQEV